MQMVSPPQRWGKTALLYGLIFRVVLAIVQFLVFLPRMGVTSLVLFLLLGIAAPVVGGVLVGRKTRSVGAGTIAGLWMGVFCGVVFIVILLVLGTSFGIWDQMMRSVQQNSNVSNSQQAAGAVAVGVIIIAGLYMLAIIGGGTGLGAIGGVIGKSIAPPPPSFYPQSYAPGYPPAMPPTPYPPTPMSPPQPYTEYPASYPPPADPGGQTPPPPPPGR